MIAKFTLTQLADAFNLADVNLPAIRVDLRDGLLTHMRAIRAEVLHRSQTHASPRVRARAVRLKDAMSERLKLATFVGMAISGEVSR